MTRDDLERENEALHKEIVALREGFAAEARIVLAQTLDVKALSKGRRRILEEQVRRMARVALGEEPPRVVALRGRQGLRGYVEQFIAEGMDDR